MTEIKITDVVTKIVDILTPLQSEERRRVISASLTLLGEDSSIARTATLDGEAEENEAIAKLPARARAWMKQTIFRPRN